MKEEYILREGIVRRAFGLAEWIDGSVSGGVIPPRIIVSFTPVHTPEKSEITVVYKYPELVHPCSDVTYHTAEPDKTYEITYIITKEGRFYAKDGKTVFPGEGYFDYKANVDEFYEKYGLCA